MAYDFVQVGDIVLVSQDGLCDVCDELCADNKRICDECEKEFGSIL